MFTTIRPIDDLNAFRMPAKTLPTMIGGLMVWFACMTLMF